MDARQYFFEVITPDEKEKSYGENYGEDVIDKLESNGFGDIQTIQKMLNPGNMKYSNDLLLNTLVEKALELLPKAIQESLQDIFIGKLRNLQANAFALANSNSYEGKLVLYQVGLSDLCLQYADMFHYFGKIPKNATCAQDVMPHIDVINKIIRFNKLLDEWSSNINYIKFDEKDSDILVIDLNPYVLNMAQATDEFILFHEISHHLLGHTQTDSSFIVELNSILGNEGLWECENSNHKREYQADALSILLMLNYFKGEKKFEGERVVMTSIGSMLTLIVFGQLAGDGEKASQSHPSVQSRFLNIVCVLESLFIESDESMSLFKNILSDMIDFNLHVKSR